LKSVTYSGFTTGSFSEFIKVNEELLYADAVFTGKSLKLTFDIVVLGEGGGGSLERAGVSMGTLAHVLVSVVE
jgi:hypothetical protein